MLSKVRKLNVQKERSLEPERTLTSRTSMQETGLSKPMHWDNPEGSDGEGGGMGGLGQGDTCTPVADSGQCMTETTTVL